jgi:hypothetical protein
MGASRQGQFRLVRQRRLAPTAHAHRWPQAAVRYVIAACIFIFVCTSISGQETAQVYGVSQFAITHSHPVAFSIAYPKGWTKVEPSGPVGTGDTAVTGTDIICFFSTPLETLPGWVITNWGMMTILHAYSTTAKEDADQFAAGWKGSCTINSLTAVKTKAGDSGYLVMSDDEERGILRYDFSFHVGKKGNIRISISLKGKATELNESLRNLVLETLRFSAG